MEKYQANLDGSFKGDEIMQKRLERVTKEMKDLKLQKEQIMMNSV